MRNQKGVSLITLVITIIVVTILLKIVYERGVKKLNVNGG